MDPTGTALIQPLLVPGLAVLDFCGSQHDATLAPFLQVCPSRCPGLKTARFHVLVEERSGLIDIISGALRSFKDLESLTVGGFANGLVNDGALEHLLMSPQFQELSLSIRSYQLRNFCPLPSDIPLRNIKNLVLRIDDLSRFTGFFRPGKQSFGEIALDFERLEYAAPIASLLTGLASHPRKSTLRKLSLRNTSSLSRLEDNFHLNDSKLFVLSFATLQPLACHTNLRKLIVVVKNPISLDDEELTDLARNWPLLEILDVSYTCPPPRYAKQITFNGLLSLVSTCPELRQVVLTLDGRQVPIGTAGGSKAITTFRFPNSPINQARLVAMFLWSHFPDTCLTTDPTDEVFGRNRHAQEWLKVHEYLLDLRKLESTESGVENS